MWLDQRLTKVETAVGELERIWLDQRLRQMEMAVAHLWAVHFGVGGSHNPSTIPSGPPHAELHQPNEEYSDFDDDDDDEEEENHDDHDDGSSTPRYDDDGTSTPRCPTPDYSYHEHSRLTSEYGHLRESITPPPQVGLETRLPSLSTFATSVPEDLNSSDISASRRGPPSLSTLLNPISSLPSSFLSAEART